MNTLKKILSSIILPFCLLTACGGSDTKNLSFSPVKAERKVAISQEKGAPQCQVKLELAQADPAQGERAAQVNRLLAKRLLGIDVQNLQAAADSFANKYTSDYRTDMAPLYREDADDALKRAWYEYHYDISSELRQERDGVTAYLATIDYYEGGAHGMNTLLTFNFDNQTGRLLELKDVFTDDSSGQLRELLLKALLKQTGCKSLDELHEKGYLFDIEMFPSENFILGNDGITFIYNAYEIAPYAYGRTELTLSNDDLKTLLKL